MSPLPASPSSQTAPNAPTAAKSPNAPRRALRPSLDPIATAALYAPRQLHLPSAGPEPPRSAPHATFAHILTSSPSSPSPEASHARADTHAASPSRRQPPSRRQSSICYLPPDSPLAWTPRTPRTGTDELNRAASLAAGSSSSSKKDHRASTGSLYSQRGPSHVHEPAARLTLAEKHADLLQFIAQKESRCLDLRAQLAVHESELLVLKHKWERIVHREFGRTVAAAPAPAQSQPHLPSPPATASPLDGLVGGARALAGAAAPAPSLAARPSPFAKRIARQAASGSVSSTTTAASSASASASTRLSQSSASSVAADEREELMVRDTGATPTFSPNPAFVAQRQQCASGSPSRALRRRSREVPPPSSPVPALVDALGPLADARGAKRASVGGVPPASIPGIGSLSTMGLGRAGLGGAAQGWVDSVGSKWAELQKGQTRFSKGQKRASVLFSDMSQSIFAALSAPASPTPAPPIQRSQSQSLIDDDEEDAASPALGGVLRPDAVAAVQTVGTPAKDDEDDEEWNW
ncbi:hypothetical protein BC834DRAFT_253164 [Gloeopeniophorella convolvens]|nr:hypothetical protein BC834DRAFT_253164 [Gloeopeniophorella convolvens]